MDLWSICISITQNAQNAAMTSALLVPITATTVKHNTNATNAALFGMNKGNVMENQTIKELALANGFKLKEQLNGEMDLNPYVYDFAKALKKAATQQSNLEKVMAIHAEMLKTNHYCYFELAYTRYTDWMVWICSKAREQDPNRIVLLQGQGSTPDEACADALNKYEEQAND